MWTEELIEEVIRLKNKGWSAQEIANEMGLTKNQVIGKLTRLKQRPKAIVRVNMKRAKPPKRHDTTCYGEGVKLIDLKDKHCRWPIQKDGKTIYCGETQRKGSSYCQNHYEGSISKRGL